MKPWLELLRISNLPTVWTNVIAGGIVAASFSGKFDVGWMLLVLVSGTCLYLAGMVLNDVFDVRIDQEERPSRPIPSGRISRRSAAMLGAVLLAVGASLPWVISIETGTTALVLAGLVVLYERIHAATAWSVLVMAACRAGLYVMAAFAVMASTPEWATTGVIQIGRGNGVMMATGIVATCVFIHVACFSLIARSEVPEVRETCPECDQIVLPDAVICPECGAGCGTSNRLAHAESRLQRIHGWWGSGTLALLLPFIGCCGLYGLITTSEGPGPDGEAFFLIGVNLVSALVVGVYLVISTRGLAKEPRRIGRFVLRSIAVLTLYDAVICGVIATGLVVRYDGDALAATIFCIACFFLVRWSHRRIPGT
ncbi:MAG: UbiA family prenyltransferase [Phycisphaera sp.]|nr:UbiA family prenyltransferase [Phycisphaera sp.]